MEVIPPIVQGFVHNLNLPEIAYVYNNEIHEDIRSRQFHNTGTNSSLMAGISVYYVPNDFRTMRRLNVFKFLFQEGGKCPDHCPKDRMIYQKLREMFNNVQDEEVKYEIADILHTFGG